MEKIPFNLEKALAGEPVELVSGHGVPHQVVELKMLNSCVPYPICVVYRTKTNGLAVGHFSREGRELYGSALRMASAGARTINGFVVPPPMRGDLTYGQEYWFPDLGKLKLVSRAVWYNTKLDRRRRDRGLVYLAARLATANAKAMVGEDPQYV